MAVTRGAPEISAWGRMPGRRIVACASCGNPIDDVIGLLRAELEPEHARLASVSDELRELIAFAHPDRWPHASELAHEIAVRIGALRERIDEREHERSK